MMHHYILSQVISWLNHSPFTSEVADSILSRASQCDWSGGVCSWYSGFSHKKIIVRSEAWGDTCPCGDLLLCAKLIKLNKQATRAQHPQCSILFLQCKYIYLYLPFRRFYPYYHRYPSVRGHLCPPLILSLHDILCPQDVQVCLHI